MWAAPLATRKRGPPRRRLVAWQRLATIVYANFCSRSQHFTRATRVKWAPHMSAFDPKRTSVVVAQCLLAGTSRQVLRSWEATWLTKLKLGFKDCEGRCRVQPIPILSCTGWQVFEIRARHYGSSVTKLSQPLGFLHEWMPTVKKCHSMSE
jgi:hypothetical protein